MPSEFLDKLQGALTQVSGRDVGPLTPERPIAELGLDSITLADLMMTLEDELKIDLERDEVEKLVTLGDLETLVLSKRDNPGTDGVR